MRKLHAFCLPPLSAHDSRHRLLGNEYVPVAWRPCAASEWSKYAHLCTTGQLLSRDGREYDQRHNEPPETTKELCINSRSGCDGVSRADG